MKGFLLMLGFIGLGKDAFAQVSVVATYSVSSSGTAASTLSWNHTSSGSKRMLVVTVATDDTPNIDSIKFNGVNLTRATVNENSSESNQSEIWYLISPIPGTAPIWVYHSNSEEMIGGSIELNGVELTNPIVAASGSNSGGSPTQNLTTTAMTTVADGIAISMEVNDDRTITLGAGQTVVYNTGTLSTLEGATSYSLTTTTTATMTYTLSGGTDNWSISYITIRPNSCSLTNNSFSSPSISSCNDLTCSYTDYTFTQTTGSGCSNYIYSGELCTVTFPAGMSVSNVSALTYNGSSVSTFTIVSSTQIQFYTPVTINASTAFSIVIKNVQNGGAAGNATVSVINASGGTNSATYAIAAFTACPGATNYTFQSPSLSVGSSACQNTTFTFTQSITSDKGSAISYNALVTITIPSGVDPTTITSGTFNNVTISSTFTTTATTVTFRTPTSVSCTSAFTIVLNGLTISTPGASGNATVSVPNVTTGTDSYSSYSYTLPTCGSNTCSAATDITSTLEGENITSGTTGSTKSFNNTSTNYCETSGQGDVWYKFTTPATLDTFEFNLRLGTPQDDIQMLVTQTCPATDGNTDYTALTYVAGSYNCTSSSHSDQYYLDMASVEFTSNWSASTTYYLQIYTGAASAFTLNVDKTSGIKANDQCSGAAAIGSTATTHEITAGNGGYKTTGDPALPATCTTNGVTLENTAWYKVTSTAASTSIVVTFSCIYCNNGGAAGSNEGYDLFVMKGPCGSLTTYNSCVTNYYSDGGGYNFQSSSSSSVTFGTNDTDCDNDGITGDAGLTVTIGSSLVTSAGDVFYILIDGIGASSCHFTVSATNSTTVPVEMLALQAYPTKELNVEVSWVTASEKNNDYFLLQRSVDAIHYETIGEVEGQGTKLGMTNYRFIDNEPYPGHSFYRLKQVDFDGKYEYHGPTGVTLKVPDEFKLVRLFPNPLNQNILNYTITSEEDKKAGVYIYDLLGNLVFNIAHDLTEGYNMFSADLSNLSSGQYFIKIQSLDKVLNQSFSIIK